MRQTGHPHFMGDVQNIHDLQLTYGMYATNGKRKECSCFTVDVQDTSALWKTVRTSRTDKAHQKEPKCDWK